MFGKIRFLFDYIESFRLALEISHHSGGIQVLNIEGIKTLKHEKTGAIGG